MQFAIAFVELPNVLVQVQLPFLHELASLHEPVELLHEPVELSFLRSHESVEISSPRSHESVELSSPRSHEPFVLTFLLLSCPGLCNPFFGIIFTI